jgi:hypothetical protein
MKSARITMILIFSLVPKFIGAPCEPAESYLSFNLVILKQNKLVTMRNGFTQIGDSRTIVEMSAEGEKAIGDHLPLK